MYLNDRGGHRAVARLAGKVKIVSHRGGGKSKHRDAGGKKPYPCLGCDKQFRNSAALKLHYEDHPDHLPVG